VSNIVIHTEAEQFPLLTDDELASIAQDIAANGLRDPIVLDPQGRVVDGRNRLKACAVAGVEPKFVTREELTDDDAIADFVLSVNVEKRSLSNGQKAMARARNLARTGKRKNGRWQRGTVDNGESSINAAYIKQMNQAGLVIDVAARAATLGPEYEMFVEQPHKVQLGELPLDAAYRVAQDFEAKAAMAEMAVWLPVAKATGQLEQLSLDAAASLELPVIDAPLPKQYREQLEETRKRFAAAAQAISTYLKEAK